MILKRATLPLPLRHLSFSCSDKISGLIVQKKILYRKTETDLYLWKRTAYLCLSEKRATYKSFCRVFKNLS